MSQKIRILHFNNSIDKNSGVMNVIMNYYRNINRNKIQFDFMYFNDTESDFKEEILSLGGKVYKISNPKIGRKYKLEIEKEFIDIRTFYSYSTMHIHEMYMSFIYSPIALKTGFKNIIGHSHSTKYSSHVIGKIRNFMIKKIFKRKFTHQISCTEESAKFSFGKKYESTLILKNAIKIENFKYNSNLNHKIRMDLGLLNKKVIGHVGRFSKEKNHKFIINTFEKVLRTDDQWHLVLIGEGSEKIKVKKLVDRKKIKNNVTFLKYQENINEYYNIFDVFIFPSLFEGLGLVGVEAQTSGCYTLMNKKLPKELDVYNYNRLSLKESKKWVSSILGYYPNDQSRENGYYASKISGYNITESAEILQKYYIEMEIKE